MTITVTNRPMDVVKRLEPVLRENAAWADAERNLPKAVMAAMVEAGIFRTWMPRAFGGLEMAPTPAIQLFEEIARIDSAAGWIASNSCAMTPLCQVLPEAGATEICAEPDTVLAGGWFPPGRAVPVDGGYRVSGQWAFGSGCQHAHWLTAMGIITDHGEPRVGPDGQPMQVMLFCPTAEAEIVDTWHTLGMRGTGSHDIKLTEVFIPERRTFIMRPFDHPGSAFRGPLYAFRLWLFGPPNCQCSARDRPRRDRGLYCPRRTQDPKQHAGGPQRPGHRPRPCGPRQGNGRCRPRLSLPRAGRHLGLPQHRHQNHS